MYIYIFVYYVHIHMCVCLYIYIFFAHIARLHSVHDHLSKINRQEKRKKNYFLNQSIIGIQHCICLRRK